MRSRSAVIRRIPVLLEAIWARKSPAVSRFALTWASTRSKTSRVDLPSHHELDRRDDHAFLVDLAECSDAGRSASSHVDVMCQARHVSYGGAIVEDRRYEGDVIEVDAAPIGEVHENPITLAQPLRAIRI